MTNIQSFTGSRINPIGTSLRATKADNTPKNYQIYNINGQQIMLPPNSQLKKNNDGTYILSTTMKLTENDLLDLFRSNIKQKDIDQKLNICV